MCRYSYFFSIHRFFADQRKIARIDFYLMSGYLLNFKLELPLFEES
jgi:hypothetical protein